ncbi:MAG: molybdopterin molybdotransferase MoeA [Desulfuromusa sp.]|nr:molybdopterin molybdotransferase MoeA [Desulfuromusa sp.]
MVKSFIEARNIILNHASPLESESVDLARLVRRVLGKAVCAPVDLPRWDNSEMDGFAVQAADCQLLAQLKVTDYIPAGATADGVKVEPGTAVRIMTGAPVPTGCDAIVPIENTDGGRTTVTLHQAVQRGDFIRFRGSDIAKGEILLPAGKVLRPADINLLAAFSLTAAQVIRRPTVAILSTGDELVAPGEPLGAGKIVDSNAYSLAAAVSEIGAIPQILGIAQDDRESLRKKISAGLKADLFITSAGVSAGDRDLVREILEQSGVHQLFWKVAIKPGGPTAFGLNGDKPVFSVPGNPVSSMIAFEELIRPALLTMMGHKEVFRPQVTARVKGDLRNETNKTRFLRVKVKKTADGLVAESAGDQNTGILSTMIRANGIAILPADQTEIAAGEQVDIQLLNGVDQ